MDKAKSDFIIYVLLVTGIFIVVLPLVYMILISVTPRSLLFLKLIPSKFTLEHYIKILSDPEIMACYRNSLVISSSTIVITLVLASLAAYGLSRYSFKGQGGFILMALITQMLPMEVLVISYFRMVKTVNLYNTRIVLVLLDVTITLPFSILILKSLFDGIPKEIEEAAMIDGCSRITCLVRIILPLSWAGLSATALFSFLMSWGEFLYALTFTSDHRAMPITVEITKMLGHYRTSWELVMTLGVLVVVPVTVIFATSQKVFTRGLAASALKR